jgi:hypothetical protein
MKGEEEEEVRLKDGKYNHVQGHSNNKKDMSTVQAQCFTESSKVLLWCELVPVLDSTMSTVRRQWYRYNRSTSTTHVDNGSVTSTKVLSYSKYLAVP